MYNLLSAESLVTVSDLQKNTLTPKEWQRLSLATSLLNIKNLKFVPYNITTPIKDQVVQVVRNSHAQLVVLDDIGALGFTSDSERESFMYQLKNAAASVGAVVVILSNLLPKASRFDPRPVLSDFDTDSIYRFCDIVQLLYSADYIKDSSTLRKVEIITVKHPFSSVSWTINMAALPDYPIITQLIED